VGVDKPTGFISVQGEWSNGKGNKYAIRKIDSSFEEKVVECGFERH